jgi:phage gp29-like protein
MKLKLVDPQGNPIQTEDLTTEHAAPSVFGLRQAWFESGISAGLTPARMAAILRDAAMGNSHDYLTLAEDMEERDLHYAGVLGVRKRAVMTLPITVEAATDDKQDIALAEDIRQLIKKPSFRHLLRDLLDGLGKGYSVCEINWQTTASKWTPKHYHWRDPRYFIYAQNNPQDLRIRDEKDMFGIAIPAYKFIIHTPRLKTGIPIRGGLARLAAISYMCKAYTIKDWLTFAEIYGVPMRLGKYGSGANKDDIAILKRAVFSLGTDAAAVIPESMQIEFQNVVNATSNGDLFKNLAEWLDKQLSKAILGQTATTEGTTGKLGNDKAQQEVREDIRDSDAFELATTINRDLIKPYIDLNYGVQENYPQLTIRKQDSTDLESLAKNLSVLVPLGLRVSESEVRDKFGLSDPKPDEIILGQQPDQTATNGQKATTPAHMQGCGCGCQSKAINSEQAPEPTATTHILERLQTVMNPLQTSFIDQIRELVNNVTDFEDLQVKLLQMAQQDISQQADMLAKAMTLAELVGRTDIIDEAING